MRNAVYGRTDLTHLSNPLLLSRLVKAKKPTEDPAAEKNIRKINGIWMDVSNPLVLIIGILLGTQEDTSIFGACPTMGIEFVEFHEEFKNGIRHIKFSTWYTVLIRNSIKYSGNLAALFEYCNLGQTLDVLSNYINLDYAYITGIAM
jgi:hypothetical protein